MRRLNSFCVGLALSLVATVTLSHYATAASSGGGYSVRGIGAQTCAQISAVKGDTEIAALADLLGAWGAGYVSQANRIVANTYDVMPIGDNAVLARIVINICKSNPKSLVESVFANLIESFRPAAESEETPLVQTVNGTNKTAVRQSVLRDLQDILIDRKMLPPNSADGQFGPRTRDAILAFQKGHSLPQTGIPDAATLITIFVQKGP